MTGMKSHQRIDGVRAGRDASAVSSQLRRSTGWLELGLACIARDQSFPARASDSVADARGAIPGGIGWPLHAAASARDYRLS